MSDIYALNNEVIHKRLKTVVIINDEKENFL